MDQDLVADENRLDVARRLYHAMCIQYPDRQIILVDSHGCLLALATGRTNHWHSPTRIERNRAREADFG